MYNQIAEWILRIPVLLFAITIHEYSHGRAALAFGDPTAKNAGRLTMNPLTHLDPIGAICLFLFNFGWAKPVPVNVRYFRNIRRETIMMSLAGPAANLAAAFAAGLLVRYFLYPSEAYLKMLVYLILMNTGLGLFNLIPIPPLDGSHVLENILPYNMAQKFRQSRGYMPMILMILLIMDNVMRLNILGRLLSYPIYKVCYLFGGDHFLQLMALLR
jgi:Zn-dependent protease